MYHKHSAQNCAGIVSVDFFFGDRVSTAPNLGKMHAAVTIMADDNHFHNFQKEERDNDFWQIIAEIDIFLFLRSARAKEPLLRTPLLPGKLSTVDM